MIFFSCKSESMNAPIAEEEGLNDNDDDDDDADMNENGEKSRYVVGERRKERKRDNAEICSAGATKMTF